MSHHMVVLGTWTSVWDAVELVVGLLNAAKAAVSTTYSLAHSETDQKTHLSMHRLLIKATLHVVARSP